MSGLSLLAVERLENVVGKARDSDMWLSPSVFQFNVDASTVQTT
jgi:hypothetical protein